MRDDVNVCTPAGAIDLLKSNKAVVSRLGDRLVYLQVGRDVRCR